MIAVPEASGLLSVRRICRVASLDTCDLEEHRADRANALIGVEMAQGAEAVMGQGGAGHGAIVPACLSSKYVRGGVA
jgi:hypothetical protein